MNEGLEAFEDIKQLISTITFAESKDKQWINEELDIIEKELKELEELAQALSIVTCENGELLKYKQVLEIIKNKCSPLLKAYLLDLLPKEEYDLVKEVLL